MTNWQEVMNKEREIQQGKNIADVAKARCPVRGVQQQSNLDRNKMFNASFGAVFHTSQRV
jgi:hypothetical protein